MRRGEQRHTHLLESDPCRSSRQSDPHQLVAASDQLHKRKKRQHSVSDVANAQSLSQTCACIHTSEDVVARAHSRSVVALWLRDLREHVAELRKTALNVHVAHSSGRLAGLHQSGERHHDHCLCLVFGFVSGGRSASELGCVRANEGMSLVQKRKLKLNKQHFLPSLN